MIVEPTEEFHYQLTESRRTRGQLEFALKNFRDNGNSDCCVKKCASGLFAVFTTGANYPIMETKVREDKKYCDCGAEISDDGYSIDPEKCCFHCKMD